MKDAHDDRTLGEMIRRARSQRGSLRDAARNLGITPSYLSDIENDRRVPAEEIFRKIADLLALDFNELMARIGRFGEEADRYMRRHPTAGALFRLLAESRTSEQDLKVLLARARKLAERRKRETDQ